MTNDTPSVEPLGVDTAASDSFTVTDYTIAPEDQPIADAILNMDFVSDVPGPVSLDGGTLKVPDTLQVSMLPPDLQEQVKTELAKLPAHSRAEAEPTLVYAALRHNSMKVRIAGGVGAGATPFHREQASIEREIGDLNRQFVDISRKLAETRYIEVVTDPVTGATRRIETNELAVQGNSRKALETEQANLDYRLKQLEGQEGDRRLKRALAESVAQHKALLAQREEAAEIDRRADEIARTERIEAAAKAKARFRRG